MDDDFNRCADDPDNHSVAIEPRAAPPTERNINPTGGNLFTPGQSASTAIGFTGSTILASTASPNGSSAADPHTKTRLSGATMARCVAAKDCRQRTVRTLSGPTAVIFDSTMGFGSIAS